MNDDPTCDCCGEPLLWLGCEYPFWYSPHDTPQHGEWVPAHNCVADHDGTEVTT